MLKISVVCLWIGLVLVSGAAENSASVSTTSDSDPSKPTPPSPSNYSTTTTTTTTTTTPVPTTTSSTTSTSTPGPTPSPPPKPTPKPTVDTYTLHVDNHTCIIMRMSLQMSLDYKSTNNNKTITQLMNLPRSNKTHITGSCAQANQHITISWNSTRGLLNNTLTMHFVNNATNKRYWLDNLTLFVDPHDLPGSNSNGSVMYLHKQGQFVTNLNKSYLCLREQKIFLTQQESNISTSFIDIDKMQFQAFVPMKDNKFGDAEECPFDTPDYVPITVGCALAGFIVIILVVYLVGRRRSQARDYLSM